MCRDLFPICSLAQIVRSMLQKHEPEQRSDVPLVFELATEFSMVVAIRTEQNARRIARVHAPGADRPRASDSFSARLHPVELVNQLSATRPHSSCVHAHFGQEPLGCAPMAKPTPRAANKPHRPIAQKVRGLLHGALGHKVVNLLSVRAGSAAAMTLEESFPTTHEFAELPHRERTVTP
jgi:hypothetical protein